MNIKELGLKVDDARDTEIWKEKNSVKRLSPASMENRH